MLIRTRRPKKIYPDFSFQVYREALSRQPCDFWFFELPVLGDEPLTVIFGRFFVSNFLSAPASLMRREQVQSQTSLGRSSLYALIKKGDFPKPVKLTGARAAAWSSHAVSEWIASRIAGTKAV